MNHLTSLVSFWTLVCVLYFICFLVSEQSSLHHIQSLMKQTRACVPDSRITLDIAVVRKKPNMHLINTTVLNQIFTESINELERRAFAPKTAFNLYLLA